LSRDQKTIAVAREDVYHPRDVWIAHLSESVEWKQLTWMNPQTEEIALGETESIRWQAPDGWEIQGFLIKPLNYEKGKRYPLITNVHGGPSWYFGYRYYGFGTLHMLAARGYAVLLPNPRGSVSWGTAFTESNVGDMGGKDFGDILAGIDSLIAQGIADANRLGIMGGSYGGFMVAWAVTQTDRFRAAVNLFGITNWLSFHGTSNLAAWDAIHLAADPYAVNGTYAQFSPMTHVQRVKTPTLILQGEIDPYVPASQSYEFFRALKDHKVETELVVYPREKHGFVEKKHYVDSIKRIVEWFERHIGEKGGK
jgi:dipeptidyl aminopeptidase/acylaminoacyl peptidase